MFRGGTPLISMGDRADRPSIVVLFPDDWASYSPTLTRLVALLSERFEVRAWVLDTGRFDLQALDSTQYRRIGIPAAAATFLRKCGIMPLARWLLLPWRSRGAPRWARDVVAVDAGGAVAAALLGRRFHYLSLEIRRWSIVRWLVPRRALSIVIQSQQRLQFQFSAASLRETPVFMLQNAPNFRETPDLAAPLRDLSRPRLVYMGNVIPGHGLLRMLDLLQAWPEASLTIHGALSPATREMIEQRYPGLVTQQRLQLSTAYLHDSEIIPFLSGFDLGLCLYELEGRMRTDYNYISSPAGKMFNYFAAGIPVIASPLAGLDPVSVHGAGLQAASNSVHDLRHAADAICADYPRYRQGALEAAREYDFATAAGAFAGFLARSGAP